MLLLRFIQPERLLRVESLPDITDFFATLQSPVTPLLPSFWAGETLFASLQGGCDCCTRPRCGRRRCASRRRWRAAHERWHFAGFSRGAGGAEGAVHATSARSIAVAAALPLSPVRRQLLVKDLKMFLRDVSQWSQLLLLLALVLVYLYNFRVLDLERIPYMSGFVKNIYAFVNLGDGGVRDGDGGACGSCFPAVSAEGAAFWIIRTSPVSMRDFLWSKFWTALRAGAAADRGADDRRPTSCSASIRS